MRASRNRTAATGTPATAGALTTPRRPSSRVARVYPLLAAHLPRSAIGEQLGLTGSQLTEAIRGNYRLGHVTPPPADVRRAQHRDNTSAAKGGVALRIRPYLALDLTARQTQAALRQEAGQALTLQQISSAYSRARHRHGLHRPTGELTVEAQRDKRRTEHELLQIVRTRQAAYAVVQAYGLATPHTLHDWRELQDQFDLGDDLVRTLRQLLPPGTEIPIEPRYRRFLVEFWEKAAYYQREHLRSIAYNPYIHLAPDETPVQVLRALSPQLLAIQGNLGLSHEEMWKLLHADDDLP